MIIQIKCDICGGMVVLYKLTYSKKWKKIKMCEDCGIVYDLLSKDRCVKSFKEVSK